MITTHMMEVKHTSNAPEDQLKTIAHIRDCIESYSHSREYFAKRHYISTKKAEKKYLEDLKAKNQDNSCEKFTVVDVFSGELNCDRKEVQKQPTGVNKFFDARKIRICDLQQKPKEKNTPTAQQMIDLYVKIIDRYFDHKVSRDGINYTIYYDNNIQYQSSSKEKNVKHIASSYIHIVLEGINKWINLKVWFNLNQFNNIIELEPHTDLANNMFASLFKFIKDYVNSAKFSHDIYNTSEKSQFSEDNKLSMDIMVNILDPMLHFVLTFQYPQKSMSPITDMQYIYNSVKCGNSIVDISVDNGGGLYIFYDKKSKKSLAMPVHTVQDSSGRNKYLVSFNNLISGSKKEYRGLYMENYFTNYGDCGNDSLAGKYMPKASCLFDISDSFFEFPLCIYLAASTNKNSHYVCIDIYAYALSSIDVRKKFQIYEIYNKIAEMQSDRNKFSIRVCVKSPKGYDSFYNLTKYEENRRPFDIDVKSMYSGKLLNQFSDQDIYSKLLKGISGFSFSVINKCMFDCKFNTLFKLMSKAGVGNTYARFNKEGEILISDHTCLNKPDNANDLFAHKFLEEIISRDERWLKKIEEYRNSKQSPQSQNGSNIKDHKMSFSNLNKDEKKYMGLVDFFDIHSGLVAISVARRVFTRFGEKVYAYMQDTHFHLVSLLEYTFLMYFDDNDKSLKSLSLHELVSKFTFDKFDYEKIGFLLRCWKKPEKDQSKILNEFVHTFFLKFAMQDGKFYVHDFNQIFDLCLAFVEIFINKNLDGEVSKKLLAGIYERQVGYPNNTSKEINYENVSKSFIDHYVGVLFGDLAYKIASVAGNSINLNNVKYTSENVDKFINGLKNFVREVLSGFDELNDKGVEVVESTKVLPYSTQQKAFEALFDALGFICMDSKGKINTYIRDHLFELIKSYLLNAVIIYYFKIAKTEKKNVNTPVDQEALFVLYKEVKLPIVILSPTVAKGFSIAHIRLPNTDITKYDRWMYYDVPEGALRSSIDFVKWIQEVITDTNNIPIHMYNNDLSDVITFEQSEKDFVLSN